MLIALEDSSKSFGEALIFECVSLAINDADKIGFIGANGAGKTTLLNVIAGESRPDTGSVSKKSGLTVGYLKQNSGLSVENGIFAEMESVFADALNARKKMESLAEQIARRPEEASLTAEYARAQALFEARGGYQIEVDVKKVLNGMGFAEKEYSLPVSAMSGGEKTRLALAKLLLMRPDLLILDEPTNHLDFKTLAWLEGYLADFTGAMLVVSHDRYFLDKAVNRIWEMEDCRVAEYKGNYSAYKAQKAERLDFQMKEYRKQQNRIGGMEDYARRNIARASTSKMAKSRLKQLSRIDVMKKPQMRQKAPSFAFSAARQPVSDVLRVDGLTVSVGDGIALATDVAFALKRGDRAALIGANGTGKSTLLKALLEQPQKAEGEIVWGKNTEIGYYDQENKDMKPANAAMDELWRRFPSLREQDVRSLLGRVLLTGDDALKRVGVLSGGERAKLGLAILMAGGCNVLVLDEPTNHLDLPARESLEEALARYDGTLLFVSHDRYFINALSDKILELNGKELSAYKGGFEEYLREKANAAPEGENAVKPDGKKPNAPKEIRREQAQRRQRISDVERRIHALEEEEEALNRLIAENPSDFALLAEKCARLDEVRAAHERAMEEWLGLT